MQEEEREKALGIVTVVPPPITMQTLIDQTASYVAKNGQEKLAVVKKTDPEGFAFLNPENKYHMVREIELVKNQASIRFLCSSFCTKLLCTRR